MAPRLGCSVGEVWWRADPPPPCKSGVPVRAEDPPPLGHDSLGVSFENAALLLESSQAFPWRSAFPPCRKMQLGSPACCQGRRVRFFGSICIEQDSWLRRECVSHKGKISERAHEVGLGCRGQGQTFGVLPWVSVPPPLCVGTTYLSPSWDLEVPAEPTSSGGAHGEPGCPH